MARLALSVLCGCNNFMLMISYLPNLLEYVKLNELVFVSRNDEMLFHVHSLKVFCINVAWSDTIYLFRNFFSRTNLYKLKYSRDLEWQIKENKTC